MALRDRVPTLIEATQEAAIVTKAVVRVAHLLRLTNACLGEILGISEATSSRLKSGTYQLKSARKEMELAVLLIRLFRGLDAIVGGDEASMRSWMSTTNTALNGMPLDLVKSIIGINNVVAYMDARRARI